MWSFMDKLLDLFDSRRFYAVIIGALVVVFQDGLGLSEQAALELATLLAAWIIGDSLQKTKR